MKLEVGSKVVYRSHGVVEVCGIKTMTVDGRLIPFYQLHIVDSRVKIMVPVSACDEMRQITHSDDLDEVFMTLAEPGEVVRKVWNRRQRDYLEMFRSSSLIEVAKVLRELWRMKHHKTLSLGEKGIYNKAMSLLIEEIRVAQGVDADEVRNKILHCLEKSLESGSLEMMRSQ